MTTPSQQPQQHTAQVEQLYRHDYKDVKPIVCFTCREVGHRSPECPKRKLQQKKKCDQFKQVNQPREGLKHNELHFLVTIDTGATVTILPKEVVSPDLLTEIVIRAKCANNTDITIEDAIVDFTLVANI